jgi:hypothetical protein
MTMTSYNNRATGRNGLPLHAELLDSDTCSTAGITTAGNAPVLALCRRLLTAGLDSHAPLQVYRDGTLALTVRSIAEGARLTVKDDNRGIPRFRSRRPGPAGRARGAGRRGLSITPFEVAATHARRPPNERTPA